MNQKSIKILAIESSCDETAAAVLEVRSRKQEVNKIKILSNIVSSQVKLHAKYGGVYPELASREHIRNILPVIEEALNRCKVYREKGIEGVNKALNFTPISLKPLHPELVDYIAVTTGPGLIGSLLVGVETAKTLAYVFNKPIISVNHLEGHIYANFIGENPKSQILNPKQIQNSNVQNSKKLMKLTPKKLPEFPALALIVSGGHTSLVYMKNHLDYQIIGETLDDAAGEAFDKVAAMLDLKYPGGPEVEACASKISNSKLPIFNQIQNSNVLKLNHLKLNKNLKLKIKNCIQFPRPMINSKDFNFSFSGLKTAVLYAIKKLPKPLTSSVKSLICYEFQNAVVETLVAKTLHAVKKYQVKSILLGGGVAANSRLREKFVLSSNVYRLTSNFFAPPKKLCTDNAAVIGTAAAYKILLNNIYPSVASAKEDKILAGKIDKWYNIKADTNLKLPVNN